MNRIEKLKESIRFIKERGIESTEFGIILGTGLGGLVKKIKPIIVLDYGEIPHLPLTTVSYHKGKLIYGTLFGKKVLVFDGRFHLYEGYDFFEITYPVRIMKLLGVQNLVISNAAGAINLEFKKGEIMLIEDHINLQGGSPLAMKNIEDFGERFVDMSQPYDKKSIEILKTTARENDIIMQIGVYVAVVGPQLETPAEYRYLKIIGADAVGMSTVPEVIVANQLKISVIAFSVLTDSCDPDNLQAINIPEIMDMAKKGENSLILLLEKWMLRI